MKKRKIFEFGKEICPHCHEEFTFQKPKLDEKKTIIRELESLLWEVEYEGDYDGEIFNKDVESSYLPLTTLLDRIRRYKKQASEPVVK